MEKEKNLSIKYEVDFNRVLSDNFTYSVYEMKALHLDDNANGMSIPLETVKESLPLFYNLPVYAILNEKGDDFMEHYRGKNDRAHTPRDICVFGIIPQSSKVELQEIDDKTYVVFDVVVYKTLLPHITKILKDRGFDVKMSIEFFIEKYHVAPNTKIVVVDSFVPLAMTALGKDIKEGIKGSSLKLVKFNEEDVSQKCNDYYTAFNSQEKINLPEVVIENMKEGIDLRKKYNRGGNKKVLAIAEVASDSGFIFEEDLDVLKQYFSSAKETLSADIISNKFILKSMCGGEEILSVTNSLKTDGIEQIFEEGGQKMDDKTVETNQLEQDLENKDELSQNQKVVTKTEQVTVRESEYDTNTGDSSSTEAVITRQKTTIEDDEKTKQSGAIENCDATQNTDSDEQENKEIENEEKEINIQKEKIDLLSKELEEEKGKYKELEAKFNAIETEKSNFEESYKKVLEELTTFKRKEEISQSLSLVEKFRHCFSDSEFVEVEQKCAQLSFAEIDALIKTQAVAFALKQIPDITVEETRGKQPNPYYDPKSSIQEESNKKYFHENSKVRVK